VRITNRGTAPVTLKNLSLKMWVNESQLVNMGQWVQLGQICQANGTGCVNVTNAGFNVTAGWLGSSCVVDATHKANQVVLFSTGTSNQTIPGNGGYWDQGLDLGIGRNNPWMDDNWIDDYSKTSSCPANLTEDSHFALYYNGALLKEWVTSTTQDANSGGEPCCGGGGGEGAMMAMGPMSDFLGMGAVEASMLAPRSAETVESTVKTTGTLEVFPSISRDGEPIRFSFHLDRPGKIQLSLYTLAGELVRQETVLGQAGENQWEWDLRNGLGRLVASGLYLYIVQVDDVPHSWTRRGKIVILQ